MINFKGKKILMLGVSYRGDVGDTRYSPVEQFYNYLSKVGAFITCHDPYIKYWNEQSLDIEQDLNLHLNNQLDIIIISTGHTIYKTKKTIDTIFAISSTFIFDTIGLLTSNQINMLKQKHTIKVLGRGDL